MGVDRYFESQQEALSNYGQTLAELAKEKDDNAKLRLELEKVKQEQELTAGLDPLGKAKSHATLHHVIRKAQLYGNLPYTHHLEAVERVLREFGETRLELLAAAWLHDIVEDTDYKIRDVRENFGDRVAELVAAVTSEDGANRKIRNALTYPKIRMAGPDAIELKLADRIANVRNGGGSVEMYKKEYAEFRHALWDHNVINDSVAYAMWTTLDLLMNWKGTK